MRSRRRGERKRSGESSGIPGEQLIMCVSRIVQARPDAQAPVRVSLSFCVELYLPKTARSSTACGTRDASELTAAETVH